MSKLRVGGSTAAGVGAGVDPGRPSHLAGEDGPGQTAAPQTAAPGHLRALIVSQRSLILAIVVLVVVVALLVLHPHVDLLESAFGGAPGKPGGGGQDAADSVKLHHDIGQLTKDASYVLVPSVSLAGAVGAIAWALGSRRGPAIVGGAVVAGVVGVAVGVIVA